MGSITAITIDLEGVGRVLLNRNLSVPIYQRSYAWEDEHVKNLLSDISTAIEEGAQQYFIGSIVTTRNQAPRAEVADGQQRLATITILLAAIRDYFHGIGDSGRASTITDDLLHKRDFRTQTLIPKLKLNDADNNYFTKRVLLLPDDPERAETPTKPSHHKIARAASLAREHIDGITALPDAKDKLADLVEYLTDCVKVIWVRVPDDTNAFMIFETLNDRGLTLAITDLLKNHLFGLSGDRISEVQRSWISMISVLEAVEEDNVVLTFIRHYWSSRHGLVREKDLYSHIKKRISSQSRAISFAAELEHNAHIYAAIVNTNDSLWTKYGETCRKHMETLNTLRMIQIRPLILSVLDTFPESEAKLTIKNMVAWSVRFLIHGGLGSGVIEAQNCQAAKGIRDKKISTAKQLYDRLKGIVPNDAQFRTAFQNATVAKSFLARYYLRALEQQLHGESDPELVPNDNSEVINLEHILPQNPSHAWDHISTDDQVLLLKRLGNLALMKTKINIKAGNDSFAFKKSFYAKSKCKLTAGLAGRLEWNREAVEERQGVMADLAVQTWPVK